MAEQIFKELLPVGARFIAGTDPGGGYALMPPGFILHEELRIMQKDGLSPAETLRTATVNAAAATGRSAEFGTVEPGKRGDLVGIEVRSRPGGGPVKVPNPLPCESTFKIRRATTSRIYIKDMVRRHRKGKKVA